MKSYIGVILLVLVQALSARVVLDKVDFGTFFGLWALVYLYILFRLIFHFNESGGHLIGYVGRDETPIYGSLKTDLDIKLRENRKYKHLVDIRKIKIVIYSVLLLLNLSLMLGFIYLK